MMRGRAVRWVGWSAFVLALAGCGSITSLEGADAGARRAGDTTPDAGLISIMTDDAGGPPAKAKDAGTTPPAKDAGTAPPGTNDGGASPPNSGTGGAPGKVGGNGGNGSGQGCAVKDDCGGLLCNALTGLCVECLVDSDCHGKTKLCDPTTLTCLCASDDDCDGDKSCASGACQ
jgi:hypothetical protein